MKQGFSYSSRALLFVDTQDPGDSTQNPDNAFLRLYRYSAELHVRPDFFLELPSVSGLFKPRVATSYRWWKDGVVAGETDSDFRFFVNEWRIQVRPVSELFLSFGKEKLLWGSSFLASPSNLLFKDTEKTRPKNEIEGKYLAKIQYLPNDVITFSLISNTQKQDDGLSDGFRPLHALKTEIMGNNFLVSLIGYEQRESRFRMGSFGQWTASDSVIMYYDGIAKKGSDALYPRQNPGLPFGGELVKKYEDSSRLFFTTVAGGSYTTLSGSTITQEFLYNSVWRRRGARLLRFEKERERPLFRHRSPLRPVPEDPCRLALYRTSVPATILSHGAVSSQGDQECSGRHPQIHPQYRRGLRSRDHDR
jgi:hypothetical protein